MKAPFTISPSGLGRYFFHDCERFLRWRSTRDPEKHGVPVKRYDTGTLMRAVLDSGRAWEETLLREHLSDQVRIAPGDGPISDRTWGLEETLEQLREAQVGEYVYQPTLRASPTLHQALVLDPSLVAIPDNRPDLVAITEQDSQRIYSIIDIKRGTALRLPYRVQVYLYARELDVIQREEGLPGRTDLEQGAAWLGGAEQPHPFPLHLVAPHVDDLLARTPAILRSPTDQLHWHLGHRCEWCEYLPDCFRDMHKRNDASRLVGITSHGKRFLRRRLDVSNLEDLRTTLQRPDIDSVLAQCASLAGERPRLEKRLEAYRSDGSVPFGNLHPALPRGENLALFITVQTEPVADRTWLLGMLLTGTQDVRKALFGETEKPLPYILLAEKESDCANIRTSFLTRLHQILDTLDHWNRQQSNWSGQRSIQLYCYSAQERERLVQLLMEALYEPDLAERAMALLFHLQGPEVFEADDHPEELLSHPIVPLVSAVGRLLALPVDVAYTLSETLEKLGSNFQFHRSESLHYPFGHGVRADALLEAWCGESADLDALRREAALRLYAYRAVLRAVRIQAGDQLVTWPPKHQLSGSSGIEHPQLSRVAFLACYESLLGSLGVRDARSQARELQAAKGKLIPLRHLGDDRFQITEPGVSLDQSDFTPWLVARDTDAGMEAQVRFDDWIYRGRFWCGKANPHLGIGRVTYVECDQLGYAQACQLEWIRPLQVECVEGEDLLLMPRYMDFNSERLVRFLRGVDGRESLFLTLLADPAIAAAQLTLSQPARTHLNKLLAELSLTDSQTDALRTIAYSRVTAVWGPPGSGKTHFLVALIQALASEYVRQGRPFRVLVTAMTHAAIENLLRKLSGFPSLIGSHPPAIGKAGEWRSEARQGIEEVDPKALDAWMEAQDVCVVGATVWALLKSSAPFDLVLIDEASQLKVPDSVIAIERLAEDGRLVAAGDHAQLGPIVNGTYPDPPDDEPVLHRSVLDLLLERPYRPGVPLCQLLENWRMNRVLTYASRSIYGPEFRCATEEVADRRLRLQGVREGLIQVCCDPDYPLVLVVLAGVQAAQTNEPEAELVAQLTIALREDLEDLPDDATFWRERLFVISPHHSQIGAIRRQLANAREWEFTPFVDTVDKMQGQEADAVLVSYGVSDPEYAAMEAEFIYGRNRLNVAITRARCKSIVFLPRPLLDGTPEILDNDIVAEGVAYMRNLVGLSRTLDSCTEYRLNEDVTAEVYRIGSKGLEDAAPMATSYALQRD